jgi:hypothetical protein
VENSNVKSQEVKMEKHSLPEGIKIIETILMGVSHYGVFCSEKIIKKGTRFGPFTGRNIAPDDIFTLSDTSYTWEVSKTILTTCLVLSNLGAPRILSWRLNDWFEERLRFSSTIV